MEPLKEGRHSFRIDDKVYLRIRYLSESQFQLLRDRFPVREEGGLVAQLRSLDEEKEELLTALRTDHPLLARYLHILDRKIDLLARQVEDELEGRVPDTRVNLGTGGLAYWHDAPLPIGAKIAVHMVLFPAHARVDALARVVHSEEDPRTLLGDLRFRVGVEFERIGKTEQETLARHLIELQCAQLRT